MTSAYDTPSSDVTQSYETHNPPLFSASGRMGRLRYLAHSMWVTMLIMAVAILLGVFTGIEEGSGLDLVLTIASLGALVIQILFAIKRVHDMNWPGLAAVITVVPLVNFLLLLWPGTKGPNKYGLPPGPNTGGIIAGALIIPFIFIFGVLAGIAVPAYNDYTARAQVGDVFAMTSGTKTAIAQHYQTNYEWPDEFELAGLGLDQPIQGQFAVANVQPGSGVIVVTMLDDGSVAGSVAGGTIRFSPTVEAQFVFECTSPDIVQKFLPKSCRGQ